MLGWRGGGGGRIRTYGRFTASGFQDQRISPLCHAPGKAYEMLYAPTSALPCVHHAVYLSRPAGTRILLCASIKQPRLRPATSCPATTVREVRSTKIPSYAPSTESLGTRRPISPIPTRTRSRTSVRHPLYIWSLEFRTMLLDSSSVRPSAIVLFGGPPSVSPCSLLGSGLHPGHRGIAEHISITVISSAAKIRFRDLVFEPNAAVCSAVEPQHHEHTSVLSRRVWVI